VGPLILDAANWPMILCENNCTLVTIEAAKDTLHLVDRWIITSVRDFAEAPVVSEMQSMIKRNVPVEALPGRTDISSATPQRLGLRELDIVTVTQEPEKGDRAWDTSSEPRRMLNEKQVLGIIPISRTTLFRLEKAGRFPRSTYISPNRRIWYADEIIAWQNTIDEFNPNRGRGKGRRVRASS
jgi:predicted DNA-binding transcriptional regulator AlpA